MSAATVCKWAPLEPAKSLSHAPIPYASLLFSPDRPYPHNHIEGLSPLLKYSSLPEGGALPLPDRHVVHSFGEGGIPAAHGHSCGYKEQQPERHDHEALPGQEQVPTDPHPRQPQLPKTPAAVRSLSPAPNTSESQEVVWGERKGWSTPEAEREKEKKRVQALRSLVILPQILPQLSSLAEPDAPPATKKELS